MVVTNGRMKGNIMSGVLVNRVSNMFVTLISISWLFCLSFVILLSHYIARKTARKKAAMRSVG